MSRGFGLQILAGHGGNGPAAFSGVPSHLWTHDLRYFRRQSSPNQPQPPPPASPAAASSSSHRSSPTLLLVFVAVAAVVFASGLLHLLIRFLKKRRGRDSSSDPSSGGGRRSPSAIQRQLQQLFTLHDAGGLDQASIDALPEFVYTELRSAAAADGPPGEPLDCAVCLCEFSPTDRLRLLPACGHAFHLACIDAWLTSSSTCPLCRGAAISLQDAELDLDDDWRDLEEAVGGGNDDDKVVFPVRLGKFRSVQGGAPPGAVAVVKQGQGNDNGGSDNNGGDITKDEGEAASSSSSWRIDERRCYSMGSYQYVLQDSALRLPLSSCGRDVGGRGSRRRASLVSGGGGGVEGRRLSVVAKGESFSVSKIWQWSNNKGRYPFPAVPSNAAPLDEHFSSRFQEQQRPEGS